MTEAKKNVYSEEQSASLNARLWLGQMSVDFQQGLNVAAFTAITLDAVIDQAIESEAIAANAAAETVLTRLRPHLPPKFTATLPSHEELAQKPEIKKQREESFRKRLADAEADEHSGPLWLYIRQAGILRAWASLEALAEDIWVQSLNRAGKRFRQQAFQKVTATGESIPGLGNGQIDVSFLAKHDFNLSTSIGTILARKFSFKTVDGIVKAFKAAFGWDKNNPAPTFPDPVGLSAVEAKRHVIAHRGGIIDLEYATKAGLDQSEVGKPLRLDGESAVNDINLVLVQGAQLLGQTAVWLDKADPIA